MKWFSRILVFLLVVPAQTILFEKMNVFGVKPDIALVIIIFHAWILGMKPGIYWGLALGGLIDLFTVGVLGVGLILKGTVGFVTGILGESFLHLSLQAYIFIFFMVSFIHDIAGFLFLHGFKRGGFPSIFIGETFIRALYDALIAVIAVLLLRKKFHQEEGLEYGGAILSPGRKPETRT